MRVAVGIAAGLVLISAGVGGPVPNLKEEPIYRAEPVSYWTGRLKAADWPTRLDGARGLREAGPAAWAAVPALLRALGDDDADVRLMAIQALGRIGRSAERAIPQLAAVFRHGNGPERRAALRSLLQIDMRSPATLTVLRAALHDDEPPVRIFALQCSVRVPDLDESEILAAACTSLAHADADLRKYARGVLTYLGHYAQPALLEIARGKNPIARNEAVQVLNGRTRLDDRQIKQLVDVLATMLVEKEEQTRLVACVVLTGLGQRGAAAEPALKQALVSGSENVRYQAAKALLQVSPQNASTVADVLARHLRNEKMPADTLALLATIGPAAAVTVPAIIEVLPTLDDRGYSAACGALAAIGPKARAAAPVLLQHVHGQNAAVARFLACNGPLPAVQIAEWFANRSQMDNQRRYESLMALARIGAPADSVVPLLRQARPKLGLFLSLIPTVLDCGLTKESDIEWLVEQIMLCDREGVAAPLLQHMAQPGARIKPLLSRLEVLLDSNDPATKALAYLVFRQHDPDVIARRDRQLLEGDAQPFHNGRTLAQWLERSRDDDPEARIEALQNLAGMEPMRLVAPALLERLEDDEVAVQELALGILSRSARDLVLAMSARHNNPKVRAVAERLVRSSFGRSMLRMPLIEPDHFSARRPRQSYDSLMAQILLEEQDPVEHVLVAYFTEAAGNPLIVDKLIRAGRNDPCLRPAVASWLVSSWFLPRVRFHADVIPFLRGVLDDPRSELRQEAMNALAKIDGDSEEVLSALEQGLRMEDPRLRRVAAECLGGPSQQRSCPAPWLPAADVQSSSQPEREPRAIRSAQILRSALADPVAEVRAAAAHSLARLGPDAARTSTELRRLLSDSFTPARIAAAEALWCIDCDRFTNEVLPVLRGALKTGDDKQRAEVVALLQRMGPAALPLFSDLVALARADLGRKFGDSPVQALVQLQPNADLLVPLLLEFLNDARRKDRAAIIEQLISNFAGPAAHRAIPLLAQLLFDEDPQVQHQSALALGQLGPAARSALSQLERRLFQDRFRNSRALGAVYRILWADPPRKEVIRFLGAHIGEHDSNAAGVTCDLLTLLGPDAETLLPQLVFEIEQGRLNANVLANGLDSMALTKKSIPQLERMLALPDNLLRIQACEALGKQGRPARSAIPALKELLHDHNCYVVAHAALALVCLEPTVSSATADALANVLPSLLIRPGTLDTPHYKQCLARLGPARDRVVGTLLGWLPNSDLNLNNPELILARLMDLNPAPKQILPDLFELCRDDIPLPGLVGWREDTVRAGQQKLVLRQGECEEGAGPLAPRLTSESFAAVQAYLRRQGKSVLPLLRQALEDPDPCVRALASVLARQLGPTSRALEKELRAALQDQRGYLEDGKPIPEVEEFYLADLLEAVAAMGSAEPDTTKLVARFLHHRCPAIQATAAWTLGCCSGRDALDALEGIPRQAPSIVRLHAALAKMRLGADPDQELPELTSLLSDPDPAVRHQAAARLCSLGARAKMALETFRKWQKSNDPSERCYAAEAAWRIQGETQTAVSLCTGLLDDGHHSERLNRLLASIGPEARPAVPALVQSIVARQCSNRPTSFSGSFKDMSIVIGKNLEVSPDEDAALRSIGLHGCRGAAEVLEKLFRAHTNTQGLPAALSPSFVQIMGEIGPPAQPALSRANINTNELSPEDRTRVEKAVRDISEKHR